MNTVIIVCLGTDTNTYGVARAFHEAFALKSHAFGMGNLLMTKHSKIIDVTVVEGFSDDATMVEALHQFKLKHPDQDLILFAAGEHYVTQIMNNYEALKKDYIIPYTNPEMGLYLVDKRNFYELCEKYQLPYPKTYTVQKDSYSNIEHDLSYPLILKPSESMDYFYLDFAGKEKAYVIDNEDELFSTLEQIYATGYAHDFLMQELVEGPPTNEFVMNVYSDKNGKVRMMSLGQILLDEPDPVLRGNYIAISSVPDSQEITDLYNRVKFFLESIKFSGLSNFDFKRDEKDGVIKCFEMNLRQGRSSYCSVAGGANYAIPIIKDLQNNFETEEVVYGKDPFVWLSCSKDMLYNIIQSTNAEKYEYIKNIKNIQDTLIYSKDRSLLRNRNVKKYIRRIDDRIVKAYLAKE